MNNVRQIHPRTDHMPQESQSNHVPETVTAPQRWPWWGKGLLIAGVWLIPPLLFATGTAAEAEDYGRGWSRAFLQQMVMWYLWAVATPIVLLLVRRVPLSRRHPLQNTAIHLVAGLVIAACVYLPATKLLAWLEPKEHVWNLGSFRWMLVPGSIVYWAIVAIGSAIDNAYTARVREHHASRLEAQLVRAHLDSLRSQLQPHFLFNTLNAIASLVRQQENQAAIEMVARLSDLLRALLNLENEHEIPLHEELDLVEQYLAIEQVRFGDRLNIEINVESNVTDCLVPTLLLQPLVENAIKHGISHSRAGGTITITATRDEAFVYLAITNDCGPPVAVDLGDSNGVGLRNTRARLQHLYDDEHRLEIAPAGDSGAVVRVQIPVRFAVEQGQSES